MLGLGIWTSCLDRIRSSWYSSRDIEVGVVVTLLFLRRYRTRTRETEKSKRKVERASNGHSGGGLVGNWGLGFGDFGWELWNIGEFGWELRNLIGNWGI